MLNVGLTGNIGSGKSSVAQLLEQLGARVIDADQLARQATSDRLVLDQVRLHFGDSVFRDGELDRAALAAIVFNSEADRLKLNAIIHPWVRHQAQLLAEQYRQDGAAVTVQDIPLLYEGGLEDRFDCIIVVTAPLDLRIERVVARSGLAPDEVQRRDAAQLPLEQKAAHADFVVDNSAGPDELEAQVNEIWRKLTVELPPERSQ